MPTIPQLVLVCLETFVVSAAATWLVRRVARSRGWLAPLRPDRWHREPAALFGGVGIFVAFALGVLLHLPMAPFAAGLLAITAFMFVTGLVDDTHEIRPQTKVVLQLTSGLLLYAAGFHFNVGIEWWIDFAIVVTWVVAITNAMNLLDNMNGLAAGTAMIAGWFRLLLFVQTGNFEGALASAVFIGAVAGFLVFNFPRGTIFMGDSGSFTIGFVLAALNLTSSEAYSKTVFSILVFPVLVLALPIFDTAFVSTVRYFSGRAISQGGRDHTSHRLVAIGLSETTAVVILWALSASAGAVAFLLYNVGFSYALFFAAIVLLGLALFGVVLSRVRVYTEGHEPDVPASAWGFVLPGELLYKRQILWVFVDAVTVVLALAVAQEAWDLLFAPASAAAPAATLDAETVTLPSSIALSVAGVVVGLFATGLYRWDWQHFDAGIAARVAAGAAAGLAAGALVHWLAPFGSSWDGALFVQSWTLVVLSVCGTRLAVRLIDRWLHLLGATNHG